MKIRLLLAAMCVLALPMWLSPSRVDKVTKSTPFAMVALAGHVTGGDWCECCTPGCICDPGENPDCQSARPIPDTSPDKPGGNVKPRRASVPDFGTGAFLIAFAFFLWSRMRA